MLGDAPRGYNFSPMGQMPPTVMTNKWKGSGQEIFPWEGRVCVCVCVCPQPRCSGNFLLRSHLRLKKEKGNQEFSMSWTSWVPFWPKVGS